MKTVTVKTPKVTGKLFVEARSLAEPKTLKFFTDATSKIRSIDVNGSECSVRLVVQMMREDRVYSEAEQRWINIPEAKRVTSFRVYDHTIKKVNTGVAAHWKHADWIFDAVKPMLETLFADEALFVAYAENELKQKIKNAEEYIKKEAERSTTKRKFIADARKAMSTKDAKKILELFAKNRY